jgi:hypothetical protein
VRWPVREATLVSFRITDENVTFLHACVEPWRSMIEDGRT